MILDAAILDLKEGNQDFESLTAGDIVRASRWWWENPDSKECGLHHSGGAKV